MMMPRAAHKKTHPDWFASEVAGTKRSYDFWLDQRAAVVADWYDDDLIRVRDGYDSRDQAGESFEVSQVADRDAVIAEIAKRELT